MGKIYVVNCTSQYLEFNYRAEFSLDDKGNRIDGRNLQHVKQSMAPGHQVELPKDFSPQQMEAVIDQLESFGAVYRDEIKTAKARGLIRLVYNLDAIVPLPICKDVKDHNDGFLTHDGNERRKRLAVATDHNLRRIGAIATDGDVEEPKTNITFELVDSADEGVEDFGEGFKVEPAASRPRGRPRKAG